jgi:hypothetical protein
VIGTFEGGRRGSAGSARAPLGDLTRLAAAYPTLVEVELMGREVAFGELDLPRARRFVLRTSRLEREALVAVARAAWPSLVELELWLGDHAGAQADRSCRVEDVAALLAAKLPALRVLRLMNTLLSDLVCEPLASSPLAGQLEEIDFGLGTLSEMGAEVLIRNRARFPRKCTLGIAECALPDHAIIALERARYRLVHRSTIPNRHRRGQKTGRNVSVGTIPDLGEGEVP